MSSHIHCDKSEALGQLRIHLSAPREPTLRNAMDEKNWPTPRVTRRDEMQLYAAPALHAVTIHADPLPLTSSHRLMICSRQDTRPYPRPRKYGYSLLKIWPFDSISNNLTIVPR